MLAVLHNLGALAAAQVPFNRPSIDWFALSPELTLLAIGALITLIDVIFLDRARAITPVLAGLGLLGTLIPIAALLGSGIASGPRAAFGTSEVYVVDQYSLVLKAIFIMVAYVIVLLSTNYIAEGDYWESEYYGLMLSSVLGMLVMASARDLITIFVALELLSIPAYLLAAWRKRDLKSNEAGLKYYLNGVFASALMLYGMSLLFGVSKSTLLSEIATVLDGSNNTAIVALGVVLVIVGFGFKVSAVPFHLWAPDTYEGAPTPVTAFLAVAAKGAGFVALMNVIFVGIYSAEEVYGPALWILAVLTMTIGNLTALRQKHIIRLFAFSGIAQAGFMLAALAVAGENTSVARASMNAVVIYLVMYAAMNLGAFAVVISVARRTKRGDLDSFNGLFRWAPAHAVMMVVFLASLAGIPPLGGFFAKLYVFLALIEAGSVSAYLLAVIAAVNTVIAFGYYGRLASRMWFEQPDGSFDTAALEPPFSLRAALGLTAAATVLFGIGIGLVSSLTDIDLPSAIAANLG